MRKHTDVPQCSDVREERLRETERVPPSMQALILKSFLLSSSLVKRREFSRASVAQLSLSIYLHLPQPGKRTRECGVYKKRKADSEIEKDTTHRETLKGSAVPRGRTLLRHLTHTKMHIHTLFPSTHTRSLYSMS